MPKPWWRSLLVIVVFFLAFCAAGALAITLIGPVIGWPLPDDTLGDKAKLFLLSAVTLCVAFYAAVLVAHGVYRLSGGK